ncbi:hypothetical protein ACGFMM_35560 [Streptomyces sp. NPDC048604]|uniref:hypothetical protein n=1 Tax=Streptomyces sp. NPDC048604 TaxID=3365578 RepID=UPI0037231E18
MTVIPLGTPAVWASVMEAAEHRCQCTGACGARHGATGLQCGRTTEHYRLLAAPADLLLTTAAAATVPAEQLLAWCSSCHRKATARQRADARERAQHESAESPALFDL